MMAVCRCGVVLIALTAFLGVAGRAIPAEVAVMVKDIRPGDNESSLDNLINANGTLFFVADDGVHGFEVWRSDGTAAGTILTRDVFPGAADSLVPLYPTPHMCSVGSNLYFYAADGAHGQELWKSDGTPAGTTMVKDIYPGTTGSLAPNIANHLYNFNGTVFFSANDGVHGFELWKSNGTAAGTVMVRDMKPGPLGQGPVEMCNVNGVLFFSYPAGRGRDELWTTDGTASGTVLVRDGLFPIESLTDVVGTLFFSASDGGYGEELWKSDGTTSGTVMIRDIRPGFSAGSFPEQLIAINGLLFFVANDSVHGQELWKSDGTASGTVLVRDIYPWTPGMGPDNLTNVNGVLFFSANDGVHGRELWKSDGTASGTVMVADIDPGSDGSYPGDFEAVGDSLFFVTFVNREALWKAHRTALGATAIPLSGSFPENLMNANGRLFFTATSSGYGRELWLLTTAPDLTVSMSSAAPSATSVSLMRVTVAFSAPVSGFAAADVVRSNAQLTNFTGSGANFSFDLTVLSQGWVTADIPASVATGASGNGNLAAPQFRRLYDTVAPQTRATGPVGSLPQSSAVLAVTFTAADSGSGLRNVRLYYRRNGVGGFQQYGGAWTASPIAFDASRTGGNGRYDFYTVGTDAAGNSETTPSAPDVTVDFTLRTGVSRWDRY
jgi:ELWxxDGT repeat protein